MIVAVLKDGMGNQLFQYAAARSLANKLGTRLKIEKKSFDQNEIRGYSLSHFSIQETNISILERSAFRCLNFIFRKLNSFGLSKRVFWYHQKGFFYDDEFFNIPNNTCLDGYWQSEKYFKNIETEIRKEIVVVKEPDVRNSKCLEEIKKTNSVSIHIRRGDYIFDETVNKMHGTCSLQYYKEAVRVMKEKICDPSFFFFSDDIEWVKQNLQIDGCATKYIDFNLGKDYEDLRLMYNCKHNIIANSSFSWWGAWLNNNPDKIVIAPSKWFSDERKTSEDIYLPSWIRI